MYYSIAKRIATPGVLLMLLYIHAAGNHLPKADAFRISPHPRILLNGEIRAQIMGKIRTDSTFARWHEEILRNANRYLQLPPIEALKTGRRMLSSASDLSKRILVLAYAWQMSRQPTFLKQASANLQVIINLQDWNPDHFLDVAELTFAMSIGYDWLYDGLDENQRQVISDAIINKGLKPSFDTRYNGWLDRTNNWNQVCNAAMITGALAIYELDPVFASRVITKSGISNQNALQSYEPDGVWPEGAGYWAYGSHAQVVLFSALETAFGEKQNANMTTGFWKSANYRLNMTGNSGSMFNYSDTEDRPRVNPCMFWLARRKNEPSLLWMERRWLKADAKVSARDLVYMMLWSDPIQFKKIMQPTGNGWMGRGENPVVVLRSGWQNEDWYVGIKGGTPSANHGHMDVGSFVLDAYGERWAMDPGTEDYHRLESNGLNIWSYKQGSDRWKVTRYQNQAHSTLTVNRESQAVTGFAAFRNISLDSNHPHAEIDLRAIYAPRLVSVNRKFSLSDDSFEITDDLVNGPQTAVVAWRLITDAEVSMEGENQISLTRNGKRLMLDFTGSQHLNINSYELTPAFSFESSNTGIRAVEVSIELGANAAGWIHSVFYPGKRQANVVSPANGRKK